MTMIDPCLPLGLENGNTVFPIVPPKLSMIGKYTTLFHRLSSVGLTMEQQAEVFLDAKYLQQENRRPSSPVEYLLTCPERAEKYRAVDIAFYPVIDLCIRTMRACSITDFARHLYSHLGNNYESAAVLNGWIIPAIQNTDVDLVVVNPPPDAVHVLTAMDFRNVTLAFSEAWIVRFWSELTDSKDVRVCSLNDLVPSARKTTLLVCSPEAKPAEVKQILNQLERIYVNHESYSYVLLIPQTCINDREEPDSLRKILLTEYGISALVLLPSGVCSDRLMYSCIVSLNPFSAKSTVSVIDTELRQEQRKKSLLACEPKEIFAIEFLKNYTIREIYTAAIRSSSSFRKPSQKYLFTKELLIQHRLEHDNRVVTNVHHCEIMSVNHCLVAKSGALIVECSDKTLHDLADRESYFEAVAVFQDHVVKSIRREFGDPKKHEPGTLSLKLYVYTYILNDLHADINAEICYELLFYPNSGLSPLCMLIMKDTSTEDVETAVEIYFAEHPETELSKKSVYNQLFRIFDHATFRGFIDENPVKRIIRSFSKYKKNTATTRKHHADHSFGEGHMERMITWLNEDENEKLALAMSLRMMALTTECVRDIKIGDVKKRKNVPLYCIRVDFGEGDDIPVPLTEEHGIRMEQYAAKRKMDLLAIGVSREDVDNMPLFPGKRDITKPMTVVELNDYAKEMIQRLNREEKVIDIPDEGRTDLSAVTASILRSNFDVYSRTFGGMIQDEIDYIRGRTMHTVIGEFYCDFSRTPLMIRMAWKLHRVINHFLAMNEVFESSEKSFALHDESLTVLREATPVRTMIELKLTIPPELDGAKLTAHMRSLLGFDAEIYTEK